MLHIQWSLSTRDMFLYKGHVSLQGTCFSTRDMLDMFLYKGHVGHVSLQGTCFSTRDMLELAVLNAFE